MKCCCRRWLVDFLPCLRTFGRQLDPNKISFYYACAVFYTGWPFGPAAERAGIGTGVGCDLNLEPK